MIKLTEFEAECREVLREVQDWLAPGRRRAQRTAARYLSLMGAINNAVKHLNNRENGCPKGLHCEDCTCDERKAGRNFRGLKIKMTKLRLKNGGSE